MSTPEKPRPSLDDTLAHIDEALAERARGVPGNRGSCLDPRVKHTDCPWCAAAPEPAPPDPEWITFQPAHKPGWLARALHRLSGDGAS